MTTLTFDTLTYVKRLKSVGVPEPQAEVQAEIIIELITEQLATKQDFYALKRDIKELDLKITAVETSLKRDMKDMDLKITAVEASLKRDMKELDLKITAVAASLKHDLTLRLGGMLVAGIGIIATLVKLIH